MEILVYIVCRALFFGVESIYVLLPTRAIFTQYPPHGLFGSASESYVAQRATQLNGPCPAPYNFKAIQLHVQDRYINICSVVINAIVFIYPLSKISAAIASAARLASSAARFFTARAAALATFSASARTLCNTLSRPSLADIRPPFKTTRWSPFCCFASAYTTTCVLYRSSLANARSVALILAPFIILYNGPRCLASCLYT